MDSTILRIITELKQVMTEHAEAAMLQPKSDPFGHGVQVGSYHGVLKALNVIESAVMEPDDE